MLPRANRAQLVSMAETTAISLSNMMATLRSIDVIANNLANASTPGFKREALQFEEFLVKDRPEEGSVAPQVSSLVAPSGTMRDLRQGPIVSTASPFDLAINGEGFFVVTTPAGERYTRNGHFQLNAGGQLATSDGNLVAGDAGAITVTPGDGDVHIAAAGTVSGNQGPIGKLRLVSFSRPQMLQSEGASLYRTDQTPLGSNARLVQGGIEASNVEPVIEISRMIEVMRAYQMTASLLQSQEERDGNTLDRLGSVPK